MTFQLSTFKTELQFGQNLTDQKASRKDNCDLIDFAYQKNAR
jgi:hypothetical protein